MLCGAVRCSAVGVVLSFPSVCTRRKLGEKTNYWERIEWRKVAHKISGKWVLAKGCEHTCFLYIMPDLTTSSTCDAVCFGPVMVQ